MLDKDNLHTIYLALGSNLGDRGENIYKAINSIEKRIGNILASSAFYVTDAVGFVSDNQFLNAACKVQTKLSPIEILQATQAIEKEMGRKTKSADEHYADRIIDIDLLMFDDEILDFEYPHLILPHPHLHERAFVLEPLAEIAGELVHPVLHKTINQLKEELEFV